MQSRAASGSASATDQGGGPEGEIGDQHMVTDYSPPPPTGGVRRPVPLGIGRMTVLRPGSTATASAVLSIVSMPSASAWCCDRPMGGQKSVSCCAVVLVNQPSKDVAAT